MSGRAQSAASPSERACNATFGWQREHVCVCARARVLQDLTPKSLRKAAKFLSDSRCWSIPVLSSAALPAPSADASAAAFAAACEEVGSVTFALCLRCGAVQE